MANDNSDGSPDWIYDIVPAKQIEEMESTAEHVEYNLKNGVHIVLSASNDNAIKLCRSYAKGKNGSMLDWMHIVEFMDSLIGAVEQHLVEENINPYD